MRKYFFGLFKKDLWGKKFWSGGHFYRTVGAVNYETMNRYVQESQGKHWDSVPAAQKEAIVLQRKLFDF